MTARLTPTLYLLLTTLFSTTFNLNAHADGALEQLQTQLKQGNYQAAYAQAILLLDEYEGDTQFDLNYAIAAIETGHLEHGVFALERVLLAQPNHMAAKLELARAYYLQGRYGEATLLFNQVKAFNPPQRVMFRINGYLAQIDKRTHQQGTSFSGFIELFRGYDDNINSGPGSQPNMVVLSNDALGRGDQFNQLHLGGSINHAYSQDKSLFLDMDLDMRAYDNEDAQDYRSLSLSGGHRWLHQAHLFQFNLFMQKYDLDQQDYRDLIGMGGSWSVELNKSFIFRTYANLSELDYTESDYRNARQATLGTSLLYAGSGRWSPLYFGSVYLGREKPDTPGVLADADVDSRIYGGNIGVQLVPFDSLKITLSMLYQNSYYKGEDWIYGIRREDDYLAQNMSLEWGFAENWQALLHYQHTDSRSNIELHRYDRNQVQAGLRYSF